MSRLRAFGRFWWNFIVGDDPLAALGIVIGISLTAALVGAGVNAWWVMPIAVALVLAVSLRREVRH
jgi:CBS-domain-containing membrane protein